MVAEVEDMDDALPYGVAPKCFQNRNRLDQLRASPKLGFNGLDEFCLLIAQDALQMPTALAAM
jgi:hypothetical protein